jgi:D-threo-aldose 1-dehydrogenase
MLAEFVRRTDVDVVMAAGRLTLLDQGASDELLPLAVARGVGVVAAAPFNSGLLSSDRVPEAATFDYAQAPAELLQKARDIAEVCRRHGVSLPAAALQYPLGFPGVVSVVAGVRTAAQAASTAERFAVAIPDELWSELDEAGLAPRPPASPTTPPSTKDSTR